MGTQTKRWDIALSDGGSVAVWIEGTGPGIVLVHGSMSDHTTFGPLIAELAKAFTVYAMDRRGFGASPDTANYSAEGEFDDVAAIVDAVADRTGDPVTLFGHSWGASCAIGGALRSPHVRSLVLYEPSFGLRYPEGYIERVEALVADGHFEAAVVAVLTEIAGMSAEQVDSVRASPVWPARVATAPTIAREARIEDGWIHRAGQFDAIVAPTLFLSSSESPSDLTEVTNTCAAAIRGARIHRLEGHDHFAYRTHPAEVAEVIRTFDDRPEGD